MIEIAKKGMIQVKVRLKKALSLLLALVMCLGCMSLPAFAAQDESADTPIVSINGKTYNRIFVEEDTPAIAGMRLLVYIWNNWVDYGAVKDGIYGRDLVDWAEGKASGNKFAFGVENTEPSSDEKPIKLSNSSAVDYYETLSGAIAAADSGDTVTLRKNYTLGAQELITINKALTLDLGKNTLTVGNDAKRRIVTDATGVTITSGKIVSDTADNVVGSNHTSPVMLKVNSGNLLIHRTVTLEADGAIIWACKGSTLNFFGNATSKNNVAIQTDGNYSSGNSATVKIFGGSVVSTNDMAVYAPSGTFTVEGGTISGVTGFYAKGGRVTISGGTIKGTGASQEFQHGGNGAYPTGNALVVEACDYPYSPGDISVTGGTFESASGVPSVGSYASGTKNGEPVTAITKFITGGKFADDPDSAYLKEGYRTAYKQVSGKYYYVPEAVTPVVTFKMAHGSAIDSTSVSYGATITQPADPIRIGYTFAGWYDSNDEAFDFNEPIKNDVTVYARWTADDSFIGDNKIRVAGQIDLFGADLQVKPDYNTALTIYKGYDGFSSDDMAGIRVAAQNVEGLNLTSKDRTIDVANVGIDSLAAYGEGVTYGTVYGLLDSLILSRLDKKTLAFTYNGTIADYGLTLTSGNGYETLNLNAQDTTDFTNAWIELTSSGVLDINANVPLEQAAYSLTIPEGSMVRVGNNIRTAVSTRTGHMLYSDNNGGMEVDLAKFMDAFDNNGSDTFYTDKTDNSFTDQAIVLLFKAGTSLSYGQTTATLNRDVTLTITGLTPPNNMISQLSNLSSIDITNKSTQQLLTIIPDGEGTININAVVAESVPVAQIGTTKYTTLQAAINAATTDDTIELLANVNGGVTIPEGKEITIDLNGKDIVGAIHAIKNYGTLTIKDTKDSGNVYTTNLDYQGRHAVMNYAGATLTIESGWFGDADNDQTNANTVQRGNAVRNWGTATINGGHYTACDNFLPKVFDADDGYAYAIATGGNLQSGEMTINNADVYGKMNGCIAADSGKLTVNDGSFILTPNKNYRALWITNDGGNTDVTVNGGTFVGKYAAVGASIDDGKQDRSDVAIRITGGSFKVLDNNAVVSVAIQKSTHEWSAQITGGIFSKEPNENYIASGYVAKQTGNWYVVGPQSAIGEVIQAGGNDDVATVQVVTDTAATSIEDEDSKVVAEKIVTTTTYDVVNGKLIKSEPTQIKAVATENASTSSTYTATITPINADGIATGAPKSVNNDVGVAVASNAIGESVKTQLSTAVEKNVDDYRPTTTVDNAESKAESAVKIETIVAELTGKIVATADANKVDTAVTKGVDVKLTVEPTLTGASKDATDPSKTVLSYDFALYATAYEKDTTNELSKMAVSDDLIKNGEEITFYVNIPEALQNSVSAIIVKHNGNAMNGAKYELTNDHKQFKVTTNGFSPYEVEFFSSNVTSANLNNVNYVTGYTLTLNDRIDVNFYTHLTNDVRDDPKSYMEITFAGLTNGHEKQITKKISDMTHTDDGRYVFTYAVAPSEGDKAITLKLHTSNGVLPIYDVNGYAADNGWYTRTLNQVTKVAIDYTGDDNLKDLTPLAKKLLAYCQYTRGYFDKREIKIDDRISKPDTQTAEAGLEAYKRDTVVLPSDVNYVGTSLVLDSETSIKIYLSGDVLKHTYWYSDGSQMHSLTPELHGSNYYMKIKYIDATKLNKMFDIYVDSNSNKSFSFSALTWAQSLIQKEDAYKYNLAAAMYDYNVAARVYFNVTN